jgi:hypothetical protein
MGYNQTQETWPGITQVAKLFAGRRPDLPGICAGCEARSVARSTFADIPLQRTSSGRDARPRTCGHSLAS